MPVVGLDEGGGDGADEEDAGQDRIGDPVVFQAVQHALAYKGAQDAKYLKFVENFWQKILFCNLI